MECILKQVQTVAKASLSIPRYYFQVLQSTSVKLAIYPQPRVTGEFISVQPGSQLAVKIEGVIQHGKRPGLFRTVNGVIITVTSQLQTPAKVNTDAKVDITQLRVLINFLTYFFSFSRQKKPAPFLHKQQLPIGTFSQRNFCLLSLKEGNMHYP